MTHKKPKKNEKMEEVIDKVVDVAVSMAKVALLTPSCVTVKPSDFERIDIQVQSSIVVHGK